MSGLVNPVLLLIMSLCGLVTTGIHHDFAGFLGCSVGAGFSVVAIVKTANALR